MKPPDHSARIQVFRGIRKVAWNPVSICQGGCLRPPGNHNGSDLSSLFRINFRKFGLRVICKTKMVGSRMKIMVVSARSDGQMYHKATRQRSTVDLYPFQSTIHRVLFLSPRKQNKTANPERVFPFRIRQLSIRPFLLDSKSSHLPESPLALSCASSFRHNPHQRKKRLLC